VLVEKVLLVTEMVVETLVKNVVAARPTFGSADATWLIPNTAIASRKTANAMVPFEVKRKPS
jgi:hypothetical protein